MVDSGIILLKYWLEVSPEEQTRRLEGRIHDPRKVWKLTDMDLKSYGRWDDYSRARDAMFAATDTPWAPWYLAHTDDKKRGRLNIISHLLSQVPYDQLEVRDIALPKRSGVGRYVGPGPGVAVHPRAVLAAAAERSGSPAGPRCLPASGAGVRERRVATQRVLSLWSRTSTISTVIGIDSSAPTGPSSQTQKKNAVNTSQVVEGQRAAGQ